MIEEDIDTSVKVIIVGNGQVGKTSMITRFAKGIFTNEYKKTLAVDFLEKKQYLNAIGEEVTFFLWDTAGQEEYDAITRTYYKGAGAAILAFSTVDRASFDAIESWYQKVTDECGTICMVLVQNKVDLMDDAQMTANEVEYLAKRLRLKLYRTCVKDNLNVTEVFQHLGGEYISRGGEAALGAQAVTSIDDMATKPLADSNKQTGGYGGNGPPVAKAAPAPGQGQTGGFQLGGKRPSVQRTGGKKSKLAFTNCSIL